MSTITKGIRELDEEPLAAGRIRRPGGGRPRSLVRDPDLPRILEALVEPLARGDPESPLRWTCKSTRVLAAELAAQQHPVSHEKVAQLLRAMDYSLQGNRKTEEGRRIIRTVTHSFSTSTSRCAGRCRRAARSFRWTRRRRN